MHGRNIKLNKAKEASKALSTALRNCAICPRRCGVDRVNGKRGYCRAGFNPSIYSYLAHHGEEPPLSGRKGSGTIFFSHCNMKCAYCQNYQFSQLDVGKVVPIDKLAKAMLSLQRMGCHNINFVSPTHYVPQIVMALEIALSMGLDIPIVYNSGGYDLVDTIRLLDGVVDIYMPDMRYSDNRMAKKYSDAPDYTGYNRESVKEMQNQVGDLAMNEGGLAQKGLIIRLLALPNGISGTKKTLKFIKDEISQNAYLSIMSQYYPTFEANDYKELSAAVSREEYVNIVDEAHLLGLNNGWVQEAPISFEPKFFGTNIQPKRDI